MKNIAQRTLSNFQTLFRILLVIGFVAGSSAVAYAGDFGGRSGLFGFRAWANGMPDLDQMRNGLVLPDEDPQDGKNYCGPTAAMNVLTFIANNGYPEVAPGLVFNNWAPVSEADGYSAVMVNHLNDVTHQMQTRAIVRFTSQMSAFSPTGGSRVWDLVETLQNMLPDDFSVHYSGAQECGNIEGSMPSPLELFLGLVRGTPMILHYGKYERDADGFINRIKPGGHYVVPSEIVYSTISHRATIGYQDSGRDHGESIADDTLDLQSTYVTDRHGVKAIAVRQADCPTAVRTMWQIESAEAAEKGQIWLMEWLITITPPHLFDGAEEFSWF